MGKNVKAHGSVMGRPPKPEGIARINVTVKVRPDADDAWAALAADAGTSKGGVVEWLALSAEATAVRSLLRTGSVERFRATLPDTKVEVAEALARVKARHA